jgi:RES domain-containing protein
VDQKQLGNARRIERKFRLRFQGTCYRAHNPKWSHAPLSGGGAAIRGGRFNPAGIPAFYLSLTVETALKEIMASQPSTIDREMPVESIDCAVISTSGTPSIRERHFPNSTCLQQHQELSRNSSLMCHE